MRLVVLAALLCFAAPARADVVRTLERGVKWARQQSSNRSLTFDTAKGQIELHPDASGGKGVITLRRWFGQTGFFLDANGEVAAGDREKLSTLLRGQRLRKQVLWGIRRAQATHRSEAKRLAAADAQIDALLASAKKAGDAEAVLHNGRASISYRMAGAPMLILTQGLSQHGIFLTDDGKGGLAIAAQDRADLAAALLAN